MAALHQPVHLFFILLVVLIVFGPGKLPQLGGDFMRSVANLRGHPSAFRRVLFMAKGVNPDVGRDVGDMLPDEHAKRQELWYLVLLAILIGNTVYFLLSLILPAAARMDSAGGSGLPALVDIWICALVFGLLSLLRLANRLGK